MLTSLHLNKKSKEVCIKVRSPPASLTFIGQVTKHLTKWLFVTAKFRRHFLLCVLTSFLILYQVVLVFRAIVCFKSWPHVHFKVAINLLDIVLAK